MISGTIHSRAQMLLAAMLYERSKNITWKVDTLIVYKRLEIVMLVNWHFTMGLCKIYHKLVFLRVLPLFVNIDFLPSNLWMVMLYFCRKTISPEWKLIYLICQIKYFDNQSDVKNSNIFLSELLHFVHTSIKNRIDPILRTMSVALLE